MTDAPKNNKSGMNAAGLVIGVLLLALGLSIMIGTTAITSSMVETAYDTLMDENLRNAYGQMALLGSAQTFVSSMLIAGGFITTLFFIFRTMRN